MRSKGVRFTSSCWSVSPTTARFVSVAPASRHSLTRFFHCLPRVLVPRFDHTGPDILDAADTVDVVGVETGRSPRLVDRERRGRVRRPVGLAFPLGVGPARALVPLPELSESVVHELLETLVH